MQRPSVSGAPNGVRLLSALIMALCLGVGGWMQGGPAWAALGRIRSSVEADRVRFSAKMSSTAAATYTLHRLTLANGGTVKEFTRSDGVVFAVAWRGPGRPDLRQLLGDNFETLQAENTRPSGRRMRRPLAVSGSSGLVLRSGGHPGAFFGLAYLPALVPSGFSPADLR